MVNLFEKDAVPQPNDPNGDCEARCDGKREANEITDQLRVP